MFRILFMVISFAALLLWIAMLFKRSVKIDIKLLISMMLFGAIGYALLDQYGGGWALFGSIFGVLIGIEIKDRFYKLLQDIYEDIRS